MGIKKFSIDVIKPGLPKWKASLFNMVLLNWPVLHIRKTNKIIEKYFHLEGGDFIDHAMVDLGASAEYCNLENIPKTGPVTVVSNHPGGADVLAAISAIWRVRHDFKILANKLICVDPVENLVIPVDTMKRKDKVNLDQIDEAYKAGELIVFYAAGKNSRYDEQNRLRDRKWRTTFLDYAIKYNTPIIGLYTDTKNSGLFYKISNIRSRFKALKNVPLENIFQLREFFKQEKPAVLTFSDPIMPEQYLQNVDKDDQASKRNFAQKLYDFVYSMNDKNTKFKI